VPRRFRDARGITVFCRLRHRPIDHGNIPDRCTNSSNCDGPGAVSHWDLTHPAGRWVGCCPHHADRRMPARLKPVSGTTALPRTRWRSWGQHRSSADARRSAAKNVGTPIGITAKRWRA